MMHESTRNLKVHVADVFEKALYEVFLFKDMENGIRRFARPGKPWEWQDVPAGSVGDIVPILSIPYNLAGALLTSLQNAGVRPIEQSKVEGLLQAQTEHLRDLQNILRKQRVM